MLMLFLPLSIPFVFLVEFTFIFLSLFIKSHSLLRLYVSQFECLLEFPSTASIKFWI